LLKKADFSAHLEAKARETAPRDVEILLADADAARERAATVSARMSRQMDVAVELLVDHAAGECAQIPFYTVSLLAEAVFYVLDPNDVIPDWIPGIGKLDDALVLELAFELGAAGIHRYCDFKEIDPTHLFAVPADKRVAAPKERDSAAGAAPRKKSTAARKPAAAPRKAAKSQPKKKVAARKSRAAKARRSR
jgi:uncharacterized membrane protein YkvA (DUF1232 family)